MNPEFAVEPTPGFEPGTFSLPRRFSADSGGGEISSATFLTNSEDGRLYTYRTSQRPCGQKVCSTFKGQERALGRPGWAPRRALWRLSGGPPGQDIA